MSLFLKKKRAQAAVELLTTYGWAIMGVMIVIGALSYFDVFDSKRFISERCDTGNQIQCLEAYAKSDGTFLLSLRNNYLVDVVIQDIYVNDVPLEYYNPDAEALTEYLPIQMNSGNISFYGNDNIGELIEGDKKTFNVVVRFRRDVSDINDCDDGICYNTSGTIVVKVQDENFNINPRVITN